MGRKHVQKQSKSGKQAQLYNDEDLDLAYQNDLYSDPQTPHEQEPIKPDQGDNYVYVKGQLAPLVGTSKQHDQHFNTSEQPTQQAAQPGQKSQLFQQEQIQQIQQHLSQSDTQRAREDSPQINADNQAQNVQTTVKNQPANQNTNEQGPEGLSAMGFQQATEENQEFLQRLRAAQQQNANHEGSNPQGNDELNRQGGDQQEISRRKQKKLEKIAKQTEGLAALGFQQQTEENQEFVTRLQNLQEQPNRPQSQMGSRKNAQVQNRAQASNRVAGMNQNAGQQTRQDNQDLGLHAMGFQQQTEENQEFLQRLQATQRQRNQPSQQQQQQQQLNNRQNAREQNNKQQPYKGQNQDINRQSNKQKNQDRPQSQSGSVQNAQVQNRVLASNKMAGMNQNAGQQARQDNQDLGLHAMGFQQQTEDNQEFLQRLQATQRQTNQSSQQQQQQQLSNRQNGRGYNNRQQPNRGQNQDRKRQQTQQNQDLGLHAMGFEQQTEDNQEFLQNLDRLQAKQNQNNQTASSPRNFQNKNQNKNQSYQNSRASNRQNDAARNRTQNNQAEGLHSMGFQQATEDNQEFLQRLQAPQRQQKQLQSPNNRQGAQAQNRIQVDYRSVSPNHAQARPRTGQNYRAEGLHAMGFQQATEDNQEFLEKLRGYIPSTKVQNQAGNATQKQARNQTRNNNQNQNLSKKERRQKDNETRRQQQMENGFEGLRSMGMQLNTDENKEFIERLQQTGNPFKSNKSSRRGSLKSNKSGRSMSSSTKNVVNESARTATNEDWLGLRQLGMHTNSEQTYLDLVQRLKQFDQKEYDTPLRQAIREISIRENTTNAQLQPYVAQTQNQTQNKNRQQSRNRSLNQQNSSIARSFNSQTSINSGKDGNYYGFPSVNNQMGTRRLQPIQDEEDEDLIDYEGLRGIGIHTQTEDTQADLARRNFYENFRPSRQINNNQKKNKKQQQGANKNQNAKVATDRGTQINPVEMEQFVSSQLRQNNNILQQKGKTTRRNKAANNNDIKEDDPIGLFGLGYHTDDEDTRIDQNNRDLMFNKYLEKKARDLENQYQGLRAMGIRTQSEDTRQELRKRGWNTNSQNSAQRKADAAQWNQEFNRKGNVYRKQNVSNARVMPPSQKELDKTMSYKQRKYEIQERRIRAEQMAKMHEDQQQLISQMILNNKIIEQRNQIEHRINQRKNSIKQQYQGADNLQAPSDGQYLYQTVERDFNEKEQKNYQQKLMSVTGRQFNETPKSEIQEVIPEQQNQAPIQQPQIAQPIQQQAAPATTAQPQINKPDKPTHSRLFSFSSQPAQATAGVPRMSQNPIFQSNDVDAQNQYQKTNAFEGGHTASKMQQPKSSFGSTMTRLFLCGRPRNTTVQYN